VLDRGRIVEDGPPRGLMQALGAYSHMYARQTRSGAEQRP
jgi:ABC-type multidrug transport system fused ATPase/permease subunit